MVIGNCQVALPVQIELVQGLNWDEIVQLQQTLPEFLCHLIAECSPAIMPNKG
jgi:hypothetical protein